MKRKRGFRRAVVQSSSERNMMINRTPFWSLLAGVFALVIGAAQPLGAQSAVCAANDRVGINYDDQSLPASTLSVAMSKIRGTHSGMVRLTAFWKLMETTQGSIDFAALDDRVDTARAAGLKILVNFVGIPNWANGSPPSCDFWQGQCSAKPTSPDFFYNFASAVANRYKTQIDYYEIWNEPDLSSPPVFWSGSMFDFHALIGSPGAAAIRAADPGAIILGPAALTSRTKLENFLSLACGYIDIVTVHAYEGTAAGMRNSVANKWTTAMRNASCVKPLWVTEFGVDSAKATEQGQANEYAAAASDLLAGRLKAQRLFYYRLEDPSTGKRWGLTREAPTYVEKPSYFRVRDTVPEVCQ